MMLLAIDAGTTNMKAGLFDERGVMLASAACSNERRTDDDGCAIYDPDQLWARAAGLIRAVAGAAGPAGVRAVGITSMAESGVVVDMRTGRPKSPVLPWFDRSSAPQAARIEKEIDILERFRASGLRPSFKQGMAKLLRLAQRHPDALEGGVWLSVSAYIAHRLTGRFAEETTLAARTFAYRIDTRSWDEPFIRHFGLSGSLFPPVLPPGEAAGRVQAGLAAQLGLRPDTQVCIAGHDHVCASLAVEGLRQGAVYNSMGTAETLVGLLEERPLGERDLAAGLSFGLHPLPGRMFWMGGHSSSGGSVEWLRGLLGDEGLSYSGMMELLQERGHRPTGILFYPYLAGCGAPTPDPGAKAAFIGLTNRHGKGDLLMAVLEGNACQMEAMRRCAEQTSGGPIRELCVVGGGVRNRIWLQVKADVSGLQLRVPGIPEAALLGAALTAGVGSGLYASFEEAMASVRPPDSAIVLPDGERHIFYRRFYEQVYEKLRLPVASFGEWENAGGG
ncbi:FGGY family carbohydrate kinase [Paenibacillus cisolokensis]|uniref:FGGY-family carbohydrate kinase n=1 Tax=Paenibacillus cisolokensis TaxID=1658519 RepID=UPI003D2C05D0